MKKSEVGKLLTAIAATDNRTIGMLDVDTWAAILPDRMTLAEAHAGLIHHRQTSDEWLTPKLIIDAVRKLNRDYWQRVGVPPMPGGLTLAQEKVWRTEWCSAVKSDQPDPVAIANQSLGINPVELPPNPEMAARVKALASKSKAVN